MTTEPHTAEPVDEQPDARARRATAPVNREQRSAPADRQMPEPEADR